MNREEREGEKGEEKARNMVNKVEFAADLVDGRKSEGKDLRIFCMSSNTFSSLNLHLA
jgi:hypothetical protein